MRAIALFLLAILAAPVVAQVKQRDILSKKYSRTDIESALIAQEKWHPYPKTPEEWRANAAQKDLDDIIKAGEETLKAPIPEVSATLLMEYARSGDRLKHSAASFGKRNNLMNLVLAESVEDKGRFTEAIMNYVWSICEETYWGVPAHLGVQKGKLTMPDVEDPTVDLFGAETAAVLALTDYFIGEKLDQISPYIRKRIDFETHKKILDPLKNSSRYGWLSKTKPVNNWNPWIVSNILIADLLLEKDEKKRSAEAHNYMGFLDLYFNSLGDDGGCDEGPSYWFAAGASAYDVLEILASATNGKVNIYDDPLVRNMAAYVYKVHIDNNYFVNFADADPKLTPDGLMLSRFGKAVKDPALEAFGAWAYGKFGSITGGNGFHRPRKLENLLSVTEIDKSATKTNPTNASPTQAFRPVTHAWLSDIEVLTAHASNGLYLATHAGHNAESHNHNDVGDFIVYADGDPVIIDAGRGNYTARTFSSKRYELWFTQSQYHNLPIINGLGQMAGRNFNARNVKSTNTEKETELSMDIAPAFAKEAGVENWNRTVKLNKTKNIIEIADDFVLKQKPDSLQQVFMTVCDVNLDTPGKIIFTSAGKKTISLTYDPKLWTVSKELPSTEGIEYSSFKTKWDSHPVLRIVLSSKALKQKGKHSFVISKS